MEDTKDRSKDQPSHRLLTAASREMEGWLQAEPAKIQAIYRRRLGSLASRQPLHDIARHLGISAERVRQLESRVIRHLKSHAAADRNGPVARFVNTFPHKAGTLLPKTALDSLLTPGTETPNHAGAILHLADAYQHRTGWYHRRDGQENNPTEQIKKKVLEQRWLSVADATSILTRWGMNPRYTEEWLALQTQITLEEGFLIPTRTNMADRAYMALKKLGEPVPLKTIIEKSDYHGTIPILQIRMGADGRFCRRTRYKYALKEWGLPRFVSLPKAMTEALTEHGGTMPLTELQKVLSDRFEIPPGRTAIEAAHSREISVRVGQVSLGPNPKSRAGETWLPVGKGLFRISDHQMVVLTQVTAKTLKGSDLRVSKTVSRVMGLDTERKYCFSLPDGTTIHLSHYRKSRAAGLGLLRKPLQALGAREGDIASIFLDLDKGQAKLEVTRAEDVTPSWQTVAKLTGVNAAAGREGLAQAMMCQPEEIEHMLSLRKDWIVLQALPD